MSMRNMRKAEMKLRLMRLTPYLRNKSLSVCNVMSTLLIYPTSTSRNELFGSRITSLAEIRNQKKNQTTKY